MSREAAAQWVDTVLADVPYTPPVYSPLSGLRLDCFNAYRAGLKKTVEDNRARIIDNAIYENERGLLSFCYHLKDFKVVYLTPEQALQHAALLAEEENPRRHPVLSKDRNMPSDQWLNFAVCLEKRLTYTYRAF